jgi:deoxyribodipyrimidine photo-lyase
VQLAPRVRDHGGPGAPAFLEELIVRRELSFNFVLNNPRYDAYEGLPHWSRAALAKHASVPRPYIYGPEDLEAARTHDPYWNAAQTEMMKTGKMHGYMRMYWGKKILEWAARPEEGFRAALRLNNMYELDGRDPNAFAGVAWCFGKHDRPWPERPVFGTVRYMNAAGLRRKFDAEAYVRRVEGIGREALKRSPLRTIG